MESQIHLKLSKEYVSFLCETNGGVPEEDVEFVFHDTCGSDVQYFYNDEEAMEAYDNLTAEHLIARTFFPIACDSFGNEILLSCVNEGVYFADCESETDDSFWTVYKVANSFSDFLHMLKVTDYNSGKDECNEKNI